MSKLIGTNPNQVPSNADLGDLAYQNSEFPVVNNLRLRGSMIVGDEATDTTTSGVITRNLTTPDGSSGDLFLFGPSPEIGFLDANGRRSSAIDGNDGFIKFYSNVGTASDSIDAIVDGSVKATASPALQTAEITRINRDTTANGGAYTSGGDLNMKLGGYQINGTTVIDNGKRGTFGSVGTTAAASALRIGMDDTNFTTNTPTMQIYHYNYPDDGTYNVPALQIRSGNTDSDSKHHGTLELAQIFTGSAYSSPMLQFKTNANASNDKGVIMLQGLSGNTPGLIVQTDLLSSSESNIDLVPYDVFYTSASQAYLKSTGTASLGSGANALRLINDRAGTEGALVNGAGLVFQQRWYNASTTNERVGGVFGFKSNGDGAFGGGLRLYTQPHNGNSMELAVELRGDGYATHYSDFVTFNGALTLGAGVSVASTGELTGCPFTHVRLARIYGSPYNDHFEGRLVVSNLPSSGQRYLHIITQSSGSSHVKLKIFSQRSGSEYMMGASQTEWRWYSEGDGDFRAWNPNGYENVGHYSNGFYINGLPTGYLVDYATNLDASSETARQPGTNNWSYAVYRIPLWIFTNSSGTDEIYITLEEHGANGNTWWAGIVGH